MPAAIQREVTARYASDLAYIHDVGFGGFARQAAPAVMSLMASQGIDDGLVVDLGCGSGIWAAALSKAGFDVLGVDFSREMLRIARKRAPRASLHQASYLEIDLPECVAVTLLGECLCYLFDEHNGPEALVRLFRKVFAALRPGGVLIFDALEPGHARWLHKRRYLEGPDWATFVEVDEDSKQRVFTRHIISFRKVGRLYRRGTEVHRLRLYPRGELAGMLRQIGFRVRTLSGYGKVKFRKGHVGYVARKPLR